MKIKTDLIVATVFIFSVIAFGRYLIVLNHSQGGQEKIDEQEEIDPREPLLIAIGCSIGPRAVRVNLGDVETAFTGDPNVLAREMARRRLSNEVKCNQSTQVFNIRWSLRGDRSYIEEQYKYNRKKRILIFTRTWAMAYASREKPYREVHKDVTDDFIQRTKY